jgi:transcriptional regulator of heat shock response
MSEGHLSERQEQILKAVIQEYIENAEPVGSEILVDKYGLDFSPATARNEMVELSQRGFLEKSHTSAGRYPSALAFRYFVKHLMEEKEIPVVSEVAIKQRLWDRKHDQGLLLREAVASLAGEIQNLSFIVTDDNRLYVAGSSHILRHPEFYDIDLTRTVLHIMDQVETVEAIFSQLDPSQDFGLLLGEETGLPSLIQCGIVAGRVDLPRGHHGYISVLGPYRLDYSMVIPRVRYIQHLLNELSQTW